MSDFSPSPPVGDYYYELIALDANQEEICRSAPGSFYVDQVYAGEAGPVCMPACTAALDPLCVDTCEGDPECLEGCRLEIQLVCLLACGNCAAACAWRSEGSVL